MFSLLGWCFLITVNYPEYVGALFNRKYFHQNILLTYNEWFNIYIITKFTEKTHDNHFHFRQKADCDLDQRIGCEILNPSLPVKFLGLQDDRYLDWKENCAVIISEFNSLKYLLMNHRSLLSGEQIILLYSAQAESHLRYGVSFWGKLQSSVTYLRSRFVMLLESQLQWPIGRISQIWYIKTYLNLSNYTKNQDVHDALLLTFVNFFNGIGSKTI